MSSLLTHVSTHFNLHFIPNSSCQGSNGLQLAKPEENFHFHLNITMHLNQLTTPFLKLFLHSSFFLLPYKKVLLWLHLWFFAGIESYICLSKAWVSQKFLSRPQKRDRLEGHIWVPSVHPREVTTELTYSKERTRTMTNPKEYQYLGRWGRKPGKTKKFQSGEDIEKHWKSQGRVLRGKGPISWRKVK